MSVKFVVFIFLATNRIHQEVKGDLNDQFPDDGDRPIFNKDLVEGDILGRKSNKERNIYAFGDLKRIWPKGTIYFDVDPSLESKHELIDQAMHHIQEKTCVRFFERKRALMPNDINDYVLIKNTGKGCSSHVGRVGGEQLLSLGPECLHRGHILHQLAHTIGLEHEHSRSDRDKHLDIDWSNIPQDFLEKFEAADLYQENLLDEPFDPTSIMMFSERAFAKNWQKPSIFSHDNITLLPIRFKNKLSQSDFNRINKIYQCYNWTLPPPPEIGETFFCDFEDSDCNIVNQENMGTYFRIENLQNQNKTFGNAMVMRHASSLAGRLLFPPMRVYSRVHACLSFELRFPEEFDYIEVVQEGRQRRVYNLRPYEDTKPWVIAHVALHPIDETEIHLIFTTYVKYSPGLGSIDLNETEVYLVLDDFRVVLTKCDYLRYNNSIPD